jgi:hypothetical protein
MLLSPVIGITLDKYAPSASALHMVLVLGFSLQALCFVLLKVLCSHAAFQVFSRQVFFPRSQLPPQPPLMSAQYYSESWNGRAATWAAGWYRCNIISMRVSSRLLPFFTASCFVLQFLLRQPQSLPPSSPQVSSFSTYHHIRIDITTHSWFTITLISSEMLHHKCPRSFSCESLPFARSSPP